MSPCVLDQWRTPAGSTPHPRGIAWNGTGGLGDLLAMAAGELLTEGLDHLSLPWDNLERLGDVLPHPRDSVRAAAGTGRGRREHPRSLGRG